MIASPNGPVAPLLEATDLCVSYGSMQVLFDVSIAVPRGETLALLGTNGAGKSTLLKAISGLVPLQRGSVRFDGVEIDSLAVEARVATGIAQLCGGNAVFPGLSVQENLLAGTFTFSRERDLVQQRLDRSLDLFPSLRRQWTQRAGSLSGGEQQMLALAKVLLLDPELLIIDELSLGLAPVIVGQLLGVLQELRQQGLSMLIVEQSLNVASALADQAVFLEKGEVRFVGSTSSLLADDTIARAVFLGGRADGR
jgi:ABC-type branched-subunit amino acid transport system ATPase component